MHEFSSDLIQLIRCGSALGNLKGTAFDRKTVALGSSFKARPQSLPNYGSQGVLSLHSIDKMWEEVK